MHMRRLRGLVGLAGRGPVGTSPACTEATAGAAGQAGSSFLLPSNLTGGITQAHAPALGALLWSRHNSTYATDGTVAASKSDHGVTNGSLLTQDSPLATPSASPAAATLHSTSHDGPCTTSSLASPSFPPEAADLVAHSSLEDGLAMVLSPTQLGVQLWEAAHASTGLPWWAAIPAATVAVRGVLLPLSLRAHAASSNVALLHRAFGLSRAVGDAVSAAEAARRQQEEEEERKKQVEESKEGQQTAEATASSTDSSSSSSGSSSSTSSSLGDEVGARSLGRVELVRRVMAHLRATHGAPSFSWYLASAAVQVPLFVSLTLALRRMGDSLWPGLTTEGVLYFTDLTAPALYFQTLSTPYGTAGAILPLGLVLMYAHAVDRSAGGTSPGINMALKLCCVPLYVAALQQPHSVLLYWLAHAGTQLGLYSLAEKLPAGAAARRLAAVEVPEEGKANAALDELLLALAESYGKAGNKAAARACLQTLLTRQPGHAAATDRLQALAG